MKTVTIKLPQDLLAWLEKEAQRAQVSKSALIRDILLRHQQTQRRSALDLAGDLCGCGESGLGDLSHNKQYLKGFGR